MRLPLRWALALLMGSLAVQTVQAQSADQADVEATGDMVRDTVNDDSDEASGVASDAAHRRVPAASAKSKNKKSGAPGKSKVRSGGQARAKTLPKDKVSSGADSEEGWIIQKTADGSYIKVPRKQTFKFEGDVSAQANRPSQTVLGQRPVYRQTTLIPERNSFRREFLEASGYAGGGGP